MIARKKEVVDAFENAPIMLLNKIRSLLVEDKGINSYPITSGNISQKDRSVKQLAKWANKYYKQEDLEEGIKVALKAKTEKVGQSKAMVKKYETLGLSPAPHSS